MHKSQFWTIFDRTDSMKLPCTHVRWLKKRHKSVKRSFPFAQIYGKDFSEIYSPATTLDTVRTVIAKAEIQISIYIGLM